MWKWINRHILSVGQRKEITIFHSFIIQYDIDMLIIAVCRTRVKYEPTILDRSLGTVVQIERFLTHAKFYPCATDTVRPYPLPPTPRTVLKPSRHNSFDLSTLYWVGRGKGTWICKNTALLFTRKLVKRIELKLRSDCPNEFCPWL